MMKRAHAWTIAALFAIATAGTLLTGGFADAVAKPRAGAKAQSGGKMYVVGVLSGIEAVDLASGRTIKRIQTGVLPHNILASADGKRLYVTNVGSQSVSVIDTATDRKIKDMLVGEIPANAAHAKLPPGRLKAATSCFECHPKVAIGTLPNAMAWAGDNKHLIINEFSDRTVVWLDTTTGKTVARKRFALPTPSTPANIAVDPKTREVWVLHRFEKDEYLQKAKGAIGAQAKNDFNHDVPAGQHTSWVTIHDPQMKRELGRIQMKLAVPYGAVFSPDASKLYVAYRSSNQVAVFDTRKRRLLRTFSTSVAPTGLALSPDGRSLYVACVFSNPAVVQVLDTTTGAIKVSLGVPPSPSLLRIDPKTGHLFVTATGYNAVLEIDTQRQQLLRELPSGHQPLDLVIVR
jgi:YVTN family beta-propeller protein